MIKSIWHKLPLTFRDTIYHYRCAFKKCYIEWCKYHHVIVYADYLYCKSFGYSIDWEHPRDLNEKIHYLEFKTDISQWIVLADKYRVREYILKKGCGELLIPIYGKWDSVDEIDFNLLPSSFVIKANNGYGDVQIIKDKSAMDINVVRNVLRHSMTSKFGIETAEIHYPKIKPCIFAEQLLTMDVNTIRDYKIWCFDGEPYCILVTTNRNIEKHTVDLILYDLEWNKRDEFLTAKYKNNIEIGRPSRLDDMLNYARILSKGFPEVRVDLYQIKEKIYFGELTFTSAAGRMDYFTPDFLKELGARIKL